MARALRAAGRQRSARIVTKGGMTRPDGAWVPDGRAKAIAADCEASLAALDGMPIDLYLIHAPDPRTPWRTSVRALARLVEEGLVRRVGVANVTRTQLDEALELAPIAAVQVALSPLEDRALRGGVVARCTELGLTLIAHSPLGGPRRAGTLDRRAELTRDRRRATTPPRRRWRSPGCSGSRRGSSRSPAPGGRRARGRPRGRPRSSSAPTDQRRPDGGVRRRAARPLVGRA